MYYVKAGNYGIGNFERMEKAIDHAVATSAYETGITVENSNKDLICCAGNGIILWTKENYKKYYEELKKED